MAIIWIPQADTSYYKELMIDIEMGSTKKIKIYL